MSEMESLLVAHQSLDEIITSYYPEEEVDPRLSFGCFNESSQAVTDFLESFFHLTSVREELSSLTKKLNAAQLQELSAELTHPSFIDDHVSWCQKMEKRLQSIAENKDLLVYYLQQPIVTNYLTMHYKYHQYLITLVEDIVDTLNNVELSIRLVEEIPQFCVLQKADSVITKIVSIMTELKNALDNVVCLQSVIPDMIEAQNQDPNP